MQPLIHHTTPVGLTPYQYPMSRDQIQDDSGPGVVNELNARQILVAEDNSDIARLLEIFLSSAGYQVEVVSQGEFRC